MPLLDARLDGLTGTGEAAGDLTDFAWRTSRVADGPVRFVLYGAGALDPACGRPGGRGVDFPSASPDAEPT